MAVVTTKNSGAANSEGAAAGVGASAKKDISAPAIGRPTEMFSRLSSQGTWSGDAADYLEKIKKILIDPSKTIEVEMKYLSDDAVAFTTDKLGVVLVREDIPNIQMLVKDIRLFKAKESFYNTYSDYRLLNIVTVNRYMFNRSSQMAAYINQLFMAILDPAAAEFNINSFNSQYKIVVDAEMANVRQFFDSYSPSPVVAGDFGFIANIAAANSENRYGAILDQNAMFAVTGNVEFIADERTSTFTPMVRVTDICSVLNSPKILALALPLIAEVLINRGLWKFPFTTLGAKDVNIGNLIVDPASPNQKLVEITNETGMRKFFQSYINAPILCVDIRAGHTNIPGLETITRPSDHNILLTDIAMFLGVNELPAVVGENCFKEITGVFETSRSARAINLIDTRDINYLNLIAWHKVKAFDQKFEPLKTRYEVDPVKRWEMLGNMVGEITPCHSCITSIIYDEFVRAIAHIVASKVDIQLPGLASQQAMSLAGIADKAFTAGVPMFGTSQGINIGGGFLRYF